MSENEYENEEYQKQFNIILERVTYDIEAAIQRAINNAPRESMYMQLMLSASGTAIAILAKKLAKIEGTNYELGKNESILLAALLTFRYAIADITDINMGKIMKKAIEDLGWISGGDEL